MPTFGDVSKYATVKAGSTAIDLSAGSDTRSITQQFAAGSSHTLFVIDDSKGDLTVSPALDSAAATETPVGSLAAGGGGLASGDTGLALLLAVVAAAGGVGAFGGDVPPPGRGAAVLIGRIRLLAALVVLVLAMGGGAALTWQRVRASAALRPSRRHSSTRGWPR